LSVIHPLNALPRDLLTQAPVDEQSRIQSSKSRVTERERLRKATREMESYFVGMLLKRMHASTAKGGLFDQKSESATYREMFDDALAAEIGKQGRFGIADMLYNELVERFDRQKDE